MAELTPRQEEILDLIQVVIEDNGMPPTRAEIARALGFKSANAAEEHLRALAKKGMIELVPGTSRGIRLLQSADTGLPVVGRVAAGQPILAEQNIENRYRLDQRLFSPKPHYLLK
ncbi:MAG: transcriptional repressor LexA, partial [Gammaproteobacteria bacterium]